MTNMKLRYVLVILLPSHENKKKDEEIDRLVEDFRAQGIYGYLTIFREWSSKIRIKLKSWQSLIF